MVNCFIANKGFHQAKTMDFIEKLL